VLGVQGAHGQGAGGKPRLSQRHAQSLLSRRKLPKVGSHVRKSYYVQSSEEGCVRDSGE
jgi:hypothetical protein